MAAQAQTTVKDAWVRGTVAGQKATGMFAQITSASGGKLVLGHVAGGRRGRVHEMAMDGNVMKMRAVAALELPAGKAVELKPGGYHVMLMDLKQDAEGRRDGAGDAGRRRRRRASARASRSRRRCKAAGRQRCAQALSAAAQPQFSAFSASLMPSLTATSGGSAFSAAAASRSL